MYMERHEAEECLRELEGEFLRVGAERCSFLKDRTALCAVLRLGIRAVSLLRAMDRTLEPDTADAYDAVRRAFLETFYLQFEFRITDSGTRIAKWFQTGNKEWMADLGKVDALVKSFHNIPPHFGEEYGELSELAHPTALATEQSCAVVTAKHGNCAAKVEEAVTRLRDDYCGILMREVWLIDAQDDQLIDLGISIEKLPACNHFFSTFTKENEQP